MLNNCAYQVDYTIVRAIEVGSYSGRYVSWIAVGLNFWRKRLEKTCWETLIELKHERCVNSNCDYNFEKACSGCALVHGEKLVSNRRSGANSKHDKDGYFKTPNGNYVNLSEGMSGTELAEMLGCTRANISQCTKKSLKRIQDHVQNQP